MIIIKTYSELIKLKTFEDRYNYLRLNGKVCKETFATERYLNQRFYKSVEWKSVRDYVITRDNGCDMGLPGYELYDKIIVHHINPIRIEDLNNPDVLLNPENLICVSLNTHNAIHYSSDPTFILKNEIIDRSKNDTCPWK